MIIVVEERFILHQMTQYFGLVGPIEQSFVILQIVDVDHTGKLFQVALKQRQTLFRNGHTVALGIRTKQTRHASRRQLSYTKSFMQNMIHTVS